MLIDRGSSNTITKLNIHDNLGIPDPVSLLGDGIVLFHSAANHITTNALDNNGIFDGIGLLGLDTNNNIIEQNSVTNTTDSGVTDYFAPGAGTGIIANPFLESESSRRGESLVGNAIRSNFVKGSVDAGISNASNIDAEISGNDLEHNGFRRDGSPGNFPGNGLGIAGNEMASLVTRDKVTGNLSRGNANNGIQVLSEQNTITDNLAQDNNAAGLGGHDLEDTHPDCDSNVWFDNVWGSAGFSPACVTAGGSGPPAPASPTAAALAPPRTAPTGVQLFSRGKRVTP